MLLIVENELGFARFLLDTAREAGFKGLVTSMGATALTLTREYKPDAISLDIHLPDIDGWRVLERLKNDITTRHIPVCVISTDESRDQALAYGALAFVAKPIRSRDVLDALLSTVGDFISRSMKSLLVVEPDAERRNHIIECVAADDLADHRPSPTATPPSRCSGSAGSIAWSSTRRRRTCRAHADGARRRATANSTACR